MKPMAFTLDLNRCTGCSACSIACTIENQLQPGRSWRTVHSFNRCGIPNLVVHHLSVACNHCAEAPCISGCPAAAFSRHPGTGAVLLDPQRCMGCRYCSWVCPYGAPRFDQAAGVMDKCTFCNERLLEDAEPACVAACPVEALGVAGNASREQEPWIAGLPRVGIAPAFELRAHRSGGRGPELSPERTPTEAGPPRACNRRWSGLRSEWSLLLFSLTAVSLVAWFTATALGAKPVHPVVFAVAGAFAMLVSLLHLGRPSRAWRAALNLRHSWVSREIVLFSTFFGLACTTVWFDVQHEWAVWAVACLGVASLLCIDMVYRCRGQEVVALPHSAMTTLSFTLLLGLLLGQPALLIAALGLKAALFLARRPTPWPAAGLRLAIGVLLPAAIWIGGAPLNHPLAVAALAVGEVMDRAFFYAELRFLDLALQIDRDLALWVGQATLGGSR